MGKSLLIYFLWLFLVVIWNYKYPTVPPLYDVIAAILLSGIVKVMDIYFIYK